MVKKGPNVPASVATGAICLALGGAIGFLAHDTQAAHSQTASISGPGRLSGGAPAGGAAAGGPGGAAAPNPGRDLTRLVSGLNTVEKVQNKGLTPAQKQQLLPLMQDIQKADSLPEAEATAKLDAVKKVLTADQQQMLADLQPQRGGRGGAGGGAGRGAGAPGGGRPAMGGGQPVAMGGPAMAGGMGSGAQQDPSKPFASERNKKALDDLITLLK